ncbi:MAG: homoserine O-succinyltransferase [Deltaproteobacteria bacterium]|nr:homoserine O-succinyltransferase [Deltaproteobacteria bacterium]
MWLHSTSTGSFASDWEDYAPIVIALVNSMPGAALRTAERQFCSLLSAAAGNIPIRLRLFYLPEFQSHNRDRCLGDHGYEDIRELWTADIDGLIVTGTEPRAAALADEPYWPTLTKIVDWAENHTVSTIWSCLAAHAAVLHLDGIDRCPLGEKLSGVFECKKAEDHTLIPSAPSRWRVPHSRYNGLSERALASRGYRLLSKSADAGADTFVKEKKSLFIFFQGHPEYDPGALLREYRRDIRRFLVGERYTYPKMPRNYFDEEITTALAQFRERALQRRCVDSLSSFPAVPEQQLDYAWHNFAAVIYTNWLLHLIDRRHQTIANRTQRSARSLTNHKLLTANAGG